MRPASWKSGRARTRSCFRCWRRSFVTTTCWPSPHWQVSAGSPRSLVSVSTGNYRENAGRNVVRSHAGRGESFDLFDMLRIRKPLTPKRPRSRTQIWLEPGSEWARPQVHAGKQPSRSAGRALGVVTLASLWIEVRRRPQGRLRRLAVERPTCRRTVSCGPALPPRHAVGPSSPIRSGLSRESDCCVFRAE